MLIGEASISVWTWITIFAGTTYGLAGFAREQVCTFMCPWPRLQGAIWDAGGLYGQLPRLSRRTADVGQEGHRTAQPRRAGRRLRRLQSCASNVCPIGIDIREGPNFACINCGLCVDACDNVMAKLARPRGLIDYESWNNIERERKGEARV